MRNCVFGPTVNFSQENTNSETGHADFLFIYLIAPLFQVNGFMASYLKCFTKSSYKQVILCVFPSAESSVKSLLFSFCLFGLKPSAKTSQESKPCHSKSTADVLMSRV